MCHQCKTTFPIPNTGRPKKFCSPRCRLVNHRRMVKVKGGLSVPDEVASAPRWVRHVSKRPVTVSGRSASVVDPGSWSSLVDARSSRVGEGLGFVLGDGIGCVDFDNVIDSQGVLDPRVEVLLSEAPNTWVEVSPSGRGLHVWGLLPEAKGRVFTHKGVSVEVYSQGRYMTVTGESFRGAPARLADLSEFVGLL